MRTVAPGSRAGLCTRTPLLDLGAAEFGIGRDEIRRRNYIRPERHPLYDVVGNTIDSGLSPRPRPRRRRSPAAAGFPARRAAPAAKGKRRGIRLGYFIEASGGREWARVRFKTDGSSAVTVGTFSHGQGHGRPLCADPAPEAGVDFEKVRLIQGDTAVVEQGNGTGSTLSAEWAASRSPGLGVGHRQGAAAGGASAGSRRRRRGVRGRPLPRRRHRPQHRLGTGDRAGAIAARRRGARARRAAALHPQHRVQFPNGCHVAEEEIDAETGQVEIVRYAAVDDVGNVINPMLVHGPSAHGTCMSGIGQALLEHAVYDKESGQFLTARALRAARFDLDFNIVPCPNNDSAWVAPAARRRRSSRRSAMRWGPAISTCR